MLDTKQESWAWLVQWVEDMPSHHAILAPWTAFILPLLQACRDEGLDRYFRVGQSMSHIIFSTAEKHCLEQYDPPPPRVTLIYEPEKRQWSIAWGYQNLWFSKPDRQHLVNSDNAFPTLKKYLADLWRETRLDEAVPPSLPTE
jgi:hypothetical protein